MKHHEKHHVSAANAFVKCEYKTRVRPGHTLIRVWVTVKSANHVIFVFQVKT